MKNLTTFKTTISAIITLGVLSFTGASYAKDAKDTRESEYRVLISGSSFHPEDKINNYTFNEDHDPFAIYKRIDGLSFIDNEYVGIAHFRNSYYTNTTALSYEGGVRVTDSIVIGGRALLMNGYKKIDNSGNLFIKEGLSINVQPFLRYELELIEDVGFFVEGAALGIDVPLFTFGFTF